jgi:hypothetical protein
MADNNTVLDVGSNTSLGSPVDPLPACAVDVYYRAEAMGAIHVMKQVYSIFLESSVAQVCASAFIGGQLDTVFVIMRSTPSGRREDVIGLWGVLCALRPVPFLDRETAGCLVHAFVRAGMSLCPNSFRHVASAPSMSTSEELHTNPPGSDADYSTRSTLAVDPSASAYAQPHTRPSESDPVYSTRSPLAVAVERHAGLALALLDLPPHCGLDVNAGSFERSAGNPTIWNAGVRYGVEFDDPPIRRIDPDLICAPALFERLLRRTDRATVSRGTVCVDLGCEQFKRPNSHVLIRNILWCGAYEHHDCNGELNCIRVFIEQAEPDGSGTDLTGGVASRGTLKSASLHIGPILSVLWPDGKFRGALALMESLWNWWEGRRHPRMRLESIRVPLILALRRIKTYRAALQPAMATPLGSGDLHSHAFSGLYLLIASYVLVPLHDESQLSHPLLDAPMSTFMTSHA